MYNLIHSRWAYSTPFIFTLSLLVFSLTCFAGKPETATVAPEASLHASLQNNCEEETVVSKTSLYASLRNDYGETTINNLMGMRVAYQQRHPYARAPINPHALLYTDVLNPLIAEYSSRRGQSLVTIDQALNDLEQRVRNGDFKAFAYLEEMGYPEERLQDLFYEGYAEDHSHSWFSTLKKGLRRIKLQFTPGESREQRVNRMIEQGQSLTEQASRNSKGVFIPHSYVTTQADNDDEESSTVSTQKSTFSTLKYLGLGGLMMLGTGPAITSARPPGRITAPPSTPLSNANFLNIRHNPADNYVLTENIHVTPENSSSLPLFNATTPFTGSLISANGQNFTVHGGNQSAVMGTIAGGAIDVEFEPVVIKSEDTLGPEGRGEYDKGFHGIPEFDDYEPSCKSGETCDLGTPPSLQARHERSTTGNLTEEEILLENFHPWPNRTVRYAFNESISEQEKEYFRKAMFTWYKKTCIQFQEVPNSGTGFVEVVKNLNCAAHRGWYGENLKTVISIDCWPPEKMIHEVGHTLGMVHPHQLKNRDTHVKVDPALITNSHRNYAKTPIRYKHGLYDFNSVMNYNPQRINGINPKGLYFTPIALDLLRKSNFSQTPYRKEHVSYDQDFFKTVHQTVGISFSGVVPDGGIDGGEHYEANQGIFRDPGDVNAHVYIGNFQSPSYLDILTVNQVYQCDKVDPVKYPTTLDESMIPWKFPPWERSYGSYKPPEPDPEQLLTGKELYDVPTIPPHDNITFVAYDNAKDTKPAGVLSCTKNGCFLRQSRCMADGQCRHPSSQFTPMGVSGETQIIKDGHNIVLTPYGYPENNYVQCKRGSSCVPSHSARYTKVPNPKHTLTLRQAPDTNQTSFTFEKTYKNAEKHVLSCTHGRKKECLLQPESKAQPTVFSPVYHQAEPPRRQSKRHSSHQ